jgi:hypothetical protein
MPLSWFVRVYTCLTSHDIHLHVVQVGGINARLAQWGDVFLRGAPGGPAALARWFTTSTGVVVSNASTPGMKPTDLVQSMDPDLLVAELTGPMVTVPGGKNTTRLLFVVSTRLSHSPAGALPRVVNIKLRSNVRSTQPIEGNAFEGHPACNLVRVGNVLPLTLSGGSAQLVGYFIDDESK